ncbi:hypothetical protein RDI58_024407 [Solanum bulbocastanum]|uniref:Uncharacterized protein n=1 Tax=Solanum bulbocastanum TaxID=147425 RepID=A0AAN8SY79_SOLBU
MDFTINTVALSEMIPTASIKVNPGASVETESPMEDLSPDARQKVLMSPSFTTSNELSHGNHFTTF